MNTQLSSRDQVRVERIGHHQAESEAIVLTRALSAWHLASLEDTTQI